MTTPTISSIQPHPKLQVLILTLGLILSFLVILIGRALAPHDLYTHHQPRTAGYSLDMHLNQRYFLPFDHQGYPATKPPMINWIGAGFLALGLPKEVWVYKLPAIIGSLLAIFGTLMLGRDIARRRLTYSNATDSPSPHYHWPPLCLGLLAATLWLASPSSFKLFDQLRPDILLIGFMACGLWLGTRLLLQDQLLTTKSRSAVFITAVFFWLCFGAALLTKGPPAALLLLYLILGAPLLTGRWSSLLRTGILWGLPLALGMLGFWLIMAARENPTHFQSILLGNEVAARILGVEQISTQELTQTTSARGGPIGLITTFPDTFFFYFKRFLPWSFVGLLALWGTIGDAWLGRCFQLFSSSQSRWNFSRRLGLQYRDMRHRLRNHPIAPCFLWVFLAFLFFSLSAFKLEHYIAPAYPAAAVFVAYWLIYQAPAFLRKAPWIPALIALGFCIGLSINHQFSSDAVETQLGTHEQEFILQLKKVTGDDPIAFRQTGYNSLQLLMGHNQASDEPSQEQLQSATWLIQPVHLEPEREAVLISPPLSMVKDAQPAPVGLYRLLNK